MQQHQEAFTKNEALEKLTKMGLEARRALASEVVEGKAATFEV